MIKALLLSVLIFVPMWAHAQPFTKLVSGPITNDIGDSVEANWGDFNKDGYLDLVVVNQSSQRNFLYRNTGDDSFVRESSSPVENVINASGVVWVDYDEDDDLDVVITNLGGANFLYRNDNGVFTRTFEGALPQDMGSFRGIGWGDLDNDGDLDAVSIQRNGGHSLLYLNDGEGLLEPMQESVVLTDNEDATCTNWVDYDNDGDVDLFIGNVGRNNLYQNKGGDGFRKLTSGPLVQDSHPTTSCAWADYDNDGDLDLYTSNVNASANVLYKNNGDGNFSRLQNDPLTTDVGNTGGSTWVDYDNDGDLDLFVINRDEEAANTLYINHGNDVFTRDETSIISDDPATSLRSSWGDYDNDGDLDLFVANSNSPNYLYRNNATNNWLAFELKGQWSSTLPVGARVYVTATINGSASRQLRVLEASSGSQQSSQILHFGLGDAEVAESVVIRWPSGATQTLTDVNANQRITLEENAASVQFVHNISDAAYGLIDVYVDGERVVNNLAYRQASASILVSSEEPLAMALTQGLQSDASAPFLETSVTLSTNDPFLAIANLSPLDSSAPSLPALYLFERPRSAATLEGAAEIFLFQGAHDAFDLGLVAQNYPSPNTRTIYAEHLNPGEATNYFQIPAQPLAVEITTGPSHIRLAEFELDLQDYVGHSLPLVISGLLSQPEEIEGFDLMLVPPDGGNLVASTIISGVRTEETPVPPSFLSSTGFPNPTQGVLHLALDFAGVGEVVIDVFNALGQRVWEKKVVLTSSSPDVIPLDASTLASGVYLYRIQLHSTRGTQVGTGTFTLIK